MERDVHIEVNQWTQEAFILEPLSGSQTTPAVSLQTGAGTPPSAQFVPPAPVRATPPPPSTPAAKPQPPGRYEVIKGTSLLAAPDSKAAVIQRLHPRTVVNVVSTEGDYVKVESTSDKPSGYVSRKALTPAHSAWGEIRREESAAPVPTASGATRQPVTTLQPAPRSRKEQERQQQEEVDRDKKLIDEGQELLQRFLPR